MCVCVHVKARVTRQRARYRSLAACKPKELRTSRRVTRQRARYRYRHRTGLSSSRFSRVSDSNLHLGVKHVASLLGATRRAPRADDDGPMPPRLCLVRPTVYMTVVLIGASSVPPFSLKSSVRCTSRIPRHNTRAAADGDDDGMPALLSAPVPATSSQHARSRLMASFKYTTVAGSGCGRPLRWRAWSRSGSFTALYAGVVYQRRATMCAPWIGPLRVRWHVRQSMRASACCSPARPPPP